MMKKLFLTGMMAVLLLLAATGCGAEPEPELPPVEYTVRFLFDGTVLSEQQVQEHTVPMAPVPVLPGLCFLGWDREITAAEADAEYQAEFAPVLDGHGSYLFPDDRGRIRADEPFTGQDLADALNALAATGAETKFPALPEPEQELCTGDVKTVLAAFFPETADSLFSDFDEAEALSRGRAAVVLNHVLGREETVAPAEDALGFTDLSTAREDYAAVMEAACPHTAGDQRWEDVLLPTGLEPGWHIEPEGRLFLADENGYQVYDTVTEDGFTLDASGYYTSGNAELDGYVTGILAGFLAEEPEADRERLLRMSYDYCCDSFTYLRKNAYYFGQTGWEVDDAVVMFSTLRGNCYNYAAAFWSLARGLGYDAQVISGTITQTSQPHGWVKMIHDGEKYYYDPEMEMTYRIKNNFSKDMFRMPRSYYSGWSYRE